MPYGRGPTLRPRSRTQLHRPEEPSMRAESGKREVVHIVHTLGVGSGRIGAGLGRIADVFGGVAGPGECWSHRSLR